jgi:hypothetical protein
LFFTQVEYCDNLIFHRRAAVEDLTQRLLDLNRNIGQPKPEREFVFVAGSGATLSPTARSSASKSSHTR